MEYGVDFGIRFTDEQLAVQELARQFAENELTDEVTLDMDRNGWKQEIFDKFVETGLLGVPIPEEYGGAGLGDMGGAIVIHELAKADAGFAMAIEIGWVCTDMILANGTEEQKQKYVRGVAEDGKLFAFCLTEPTTGSDAAQLRTRAVKKDDTWVINGSKAWITNPGVCDYYLMMAVTDKEKGAKGVSSFLFGKEMRGNGLTIDAEEDKMGMRSSDTHGMSFNDMTLPADALLGKEGMGFIYAMQGLDGGRISCSAISLGISEHAFRIARDYSKTRIAFGKPICANQAVSFKLANMFTYITAMKHMLYNVAAAKQSGVRCSTEAAASKIFCAKNATKIALDAVQILGGYGYSREYVVERLVRDNKLMEIGEGTNEVQNIVISGAILK